MKIGVVIITYQKLDGSSPSLLKRAIDSIKNQTHQDYTLIVIGDKYEDDDEFKSICNQDIFFGLFAVGNISGIYPTL
jgi:glycosyltransferase involved in cell wall biosynthesis